MRPALLAVRVVPRASRDEIAGWQGDVLRVRVTAAPADGRANAAVVALLAAAAGVSPSAVELVRGATSRDKLFRVGQRRLADLRSRLARPGGPEGDAGRSAPRRREGVGGR
ncbi:MAG TPA: DUF167 domain-containing protein [Candidatus Binatia bacterium]|nr:DUF167 domain-containing protein [Candidatus Binatia bacterium]